MKIREATINDLPEIVRILSEDFLGQEREEFNDPLKSEYLLSFHEIQQNPNNSLFVAELKNKVVAVMQLVFIASLVSKGSKIMEIKTFFVDQKFCGQGIGKKMIDFSLKIAKERNCKIVQLVSSPKRKDAHRFYEREGFTISYIGMKLVIS